MALRRFHVGGTFKEWRGNSDLYVGPGQLELRPSSLIRKFSRAATVVHGGSTVTVYEARWLPPWPNCALVVNDGEHRVRATFGPWKRRKIVATLESNGFEVERKVSSFGRGFDQLTY